MIFPVHSTIFPVLPAKIRAAVRKPQNYPIKPTFLFSGRPVRTSTTHPFFGTAADIPPPCFSLRCKGSRVFAKDFRHFYQKKERRFVTMPNFQNFKICGRKISQNRPIAKQNRLFTFGCKFVTIILINWRCVYERRGRPAQIRHDVKSTASVFLPRKRLLFATLLLKAVQF